MIKEVVDELVEIEAAAAKIAENAGMEKAKLAQDYLDREEEYNRKLQQDRNQKIEAMKAENDRKIQERIQWMQEEHIMEIQQLEEQYESSHTKLAQGIVNILTGV